MRAGVAVLLLLLGACRAPPQVRVHLTADPAAAARAASLELVVFDGDDQEVYRRSAPFDGDGAIPRLDRAPALLTLLPRGRDVDRRFLLVAALRDGAGAAVNELRAAGGYEDGVREIWLHFEDACTDVAPCPRFQSCAAGACVDACVVLTEPGATMRSERRPCGCAFAEAAARCTTDDGLSGRCWAGSCCAGCWDGARCRAGLEHAACGTAGAECIACCEECSPTGTCTDLDAGGIRAAGAHTCALAGGHGYCWGENAAGQVGTGDTEDRCAPTQVLPSVGEVQVSIAFSCAMGFGGDLGNPLGCWGANDVGQLPYATMPLVEPPAFVEPGWTQIALGRDHGCGIRVPGELHCWGNCWNGQCGVATDPDVGLPPVRPPARVGSRSDWERVAAGRFTTCAIAAGELYCFGHNVEGQTAQPPAERILAPTLVPHDERWVSLAMAHVGTCAIDARERLFCWGDVKGALRIEPALPRYVPGQLPGRFRQVALTDDHGCTIDADGALHCWGDNDRGQLATDVPEEERGIGLVRSGPPGFTWSEVAVGQAMTCAIRTDGELFCWGSDDDCRIGGGGDSAVVRHLCLPR